MTEGDQLVKANLQTFVCVCKDTFSNMAIDSKIVQDSFAKIEKITFEKMHDKPILFKTPFSIQPECDFSFSTLKHLKQIHDSEGYAFNLTSVRSLDLSYRNLIF
jgi:tRNA A37 threonylcarbamoyltransferase TsaD